MKSKTSLEVLLDRRSEVYHGRYAIKMMCFSMGLCAIAISTSVSSFPPTIALGFGVCLVLILISGPLSRRIFPSLYITGEELQQIEREEGWFNKNLLALFYAKHGHPKRGSSLDSPFEASDVAGLPLVGANFNVAVQGVLGAKRLEQYPINDVCALVEASARLDGLGIPTAVQTHNLGRKASMHLGVGVFIFGLVVCSGIIATALKFIGHI